jgi:hypothetical protein
MNTSSSKGLPIGFFTFQHTAWTSQAFFEMLEEAFKTPVNSYILPPCKTSIRWMMSRYVASWRVAGTLEPWLQPLLRAWIPEMGKHFPIQPCMGRALRSSQSISNDLYLYNLKPWMAGIQPIPKMPSIQYKAFHFFLMVLICSATTPSLAHFTHYFSGKIESFSIFFLVCFAQNSHCISG